MIPIIFFLDVSIHLLLLAGVGWSIARPVKRVWPPPGRGSWQHRLTWLLFYLVFALNAALLVVDWDSRRFGGPLRFVLAAPLVLTGMLLVGWGMRALGAHNTSGLKGGPIRNGPYRFTRNPQYLKDMLLFLGLSLAANSLHLWITHALTTLVFAFTPWAEETWLEEQYGDAYRVYRLETPRFFMKGNPGPHDCCCGIFDR